MKKENYEYYILVGSQFGIAIARNSTPAFITSWIATIMVFCYSNIIDKEVKNKLEKDEKES